MCVFTVKLAICPCAQNRTDKPEKNCVRSGKPYEVFVTGKEYRDVLDVTDGVGLASEAACELQIDMHGPEAEATMFCPKMRWAHEKRKATRDLVEDTKCRDCQKGCRRISG
jgi:hypothetical protein